MSNLIIPDFGNDKQQLFDWFKLNKGLYLRQKKTEIKHSNGFFVNLPKEFIITPDVNKEVGITSVDTKKMNGKVVINATNIIDSHKDLHIPKLWNRSLKMQANNGLHLKEHKMCFDNVLADGPQEVKPYVTNMSWSSLGFNVEGKSQCLIHDFVLKRYDNPQLNELTKAEMYLRYLNGEVKYHSVGMIYVDIAFCVDTEEKYWAEEKDNFDKYITEAINPEVAKEEGWFCAVLEAKYVEGSAVVRPSNVATPTVSFSEDKAAPDVVTADNHKVEPLPSTQQTKTIDWNKVNFIQ